MFADALSWLHSLGGNWFWILVAAVAIVLLVWLLVELADRRDERRIEEEAQEEARQQAAASQSRKLPRAPTLPVWVGSPPAEPEPVAPVSDAVIQSIRKRAARPRPAPLKRAKTPNRRKVARHK